MTNRFVTDEEIVNLTSHHPPQNKATIEAHERVREMVRQLALELNELLPECPQKTTLLRQDLPLVMMKSNQIIAVNGIEETLP